MRIPASAKALDFPYVLHVEYKAGEWPFGKSPENRNELPMCISRVTYELTCHQDMSLRLIRGRVRLVISLIDQGLSLIGIANHDYRRMHQGKTVEIFILTFVWNIRMVWENVNFCEKTFFILLYFISYILEESSHQDSTISHQHVISIPWTSVSYRWDVFIPIQQFHCMVICFNWIFFTNTSIPNQYFKSIEVLVTKTSMRVVWHAHVAMRYGSSVSYYCIYSYYMICVSYVCMFSYCLIVFSYWWTI